MDLTLKTQEQRYFHFSHVCHLIVEVLFQDDFISDFQKQSVKEDEVCMKMPAEIEEIEYTDEVTCTHKEFESCHNTFKSVLRKSMVTSNHMHSFNLIEGF